MKLIEKLLFGIMGILVACTMFIIACAAMPGLSKEVGRYVTPKNTAQSSAESSSEEVTLSDAASAEEIVLSENASAEDSVLLTVTQTEQPVISEATSVVKAEETLQDNGVSVKYVGDATGDSLELIGFIGQSAKDLTNSLGIVNNEGLRSAFTAGVLSYGGVNLQIWNGTGNIYLINLAEDDKTTDCSLLGLKPGMGYEEGVQKIKKQYGAEEWIGQSVTGYTFYFYRNEEPVFGTIYYEGDKITSIQVNLDITGTIDPRKKTEINNSAMRPAEGNGG